MVKVSFKVCFRKAPTWIWRPMSRLSLLPIAFLTLAQPSCFLCSMFLVNCALFFMVVFRFCGSMLFWLFCCCCSRCRCLLLMLFRRTVSGHGSSSVWSTPWSRPVAETSRRHLFRLCVLHVLQVESNYIYIFIINYNIMLCHNHII